MDEVIDLLIDWRLTARNVNTISSFYANCEGGKLTEETKDGQ